MDTYISQEHTRHGAETIDTFDTLISWLQTIDKWFYKKQKWF